MKRALWVFVVAFQAFAQTPVEISPEELNSVISPPRIEGATSCPSSGRLRVSLEGGYPGNYYYVYEFDPTVLSQGQLLGRFPVDNNSEGKTYAEIALNSATPLIGAIQVNPNRDTSRFSDLFQVDDPAMRGRGGELPFPLWTCGRATFSFDHQPGDELAFYGLDPNLGGGFPNYLRFVVPTALSRRDYVPAGAGGAFRHQERFRLDTVGCEGRLEPSTSEAWLYVGGQQLPRLRFDWGHVIPGAPSFVIGGVVSGSLQRFSLTRHNTLSQWTEVCVDSTCTVRVPTPLGPLEPGDELTATQELCDGTTSVVASAKVSECGDMMLPRLVNLPRHGDLSNLVEMAPQGVATVALVGDGFGPRDNLHVLGISSNSRFIGFTRALTSTDTWLVVAQPTSVCPTPLGADYSIVP